LVGPRKSCAPHPWIGPSRGRHAFSTQPMKCIAAYQARFRPAAALYRSVPLPPSCWMPSRAIRTCTRSLDCRAKRLLGGPASQLRNLAVMSSLTELAGDVAELVRIAYNSNANHSLVGDRKDVDGIQPAVHAYHHRRIEICFNYLDRNFF